MMDTLMSVEEVGRRGEEIFARKVQRLVAGQDAGRFVTVDINSEDFEVGDDHLATVRKIRERHPDGEFYTRRVGFDYTVTMGSRIQPADR